MGRSTELPPQILLTSYRHTCTLRTQSVTKMPKQSRGFFTCDFCGFAHDTLEEATEHEQTQCTKRPPQPAHYRGPPPRYNNEPENSFLGVAATPHHTLRFRVVPLMGPNDNRTLVAKEDIPAVNSLDLFEAPPDLASLFDGSGGTPVMTRQVGLRCSYCSTSKPNHKNTIFPATLASIASDVRLIADNHLPNCEFAPDDIRDACLQAIRHRRESSDEQNRMNLVEYCVGFCRHLGITNKHPHKMGIAFADTEGHLMPYTPSETPATLRGPPSGAMYSLGDRMGLPSSNEHRMGFPTVTRPMSMMGGHMMGPGDAIAPTPLQRRRDRPDPTMDRGLYPNSAERSYAAQTPAGFPTPFSQGPPGSDGRYGQDVQTPAQPVFEGKGQTPMSSHRSESSSPPQGYPAYDLPPNFPFYQETDRTWHCKFCCHVHPSYRDPQAIWQASGGAPPPGNFIDSHLGMCRAYHQSTMPPPMYQGPPPPYGAPWMVAGYPPPPGWDGHSPPHTGAGTPPSHHHHGQYPGPLPGPQDLQYPYPPMSHQEFEASRKTAVLPDQNRNLVAQHVPEQRSNEPPIQMHVVQLLIFPLLKRNT